MQLIERVNLTAAQWLKTQPKTYIQDILKRKDEDDDKMDVKYNRLNNFLDGMIKTNGEMVRLYKYSLENNGIPCGRLFGSLGVQGLQKEFRGLLMSHTTDIDMCNAHPTILRYVCKKHSIACPRLTEYVDNRDEILQQFPDKAKAKTLFYSCMNYDKRFRGINNTFFKQFDAEMKDIQKTLSRLTDYTTLSVKIRDKGVVNHDGKLLNIILNLYENYILQECITYINSIDMEIAVLMFDGLMVYGNYYEDIGLLDALTNHIESKFNGLEMKWAYKPHNMELTVPEDFIGVKSKSKEEQDKLDNIARIQDELDKRTIEFEKTHCKIVNRGTYICEYPDNAKDKICIKTIKQLSDAYSHEEIAFDRYALTKGTINARSWIDYWTCANPNIRKYVDMGIYPDPTKCPTNIYNLWTPFSGSLLPQATNEQAVEMTLNHIHILCGNDANVSLYMRMWIAQMIQYPDIKSNCPVLISKEGAGKGSFMQLICRLLGMDKYFETSNPSRDVWGNFNGEMATSFFVNLNELSKKDTIDSMGQIKALITDSSMIINQKGVAQYPITSYHRFIITTNKDDPIDTKTDDRRFWLVRSSDELLHNTDYFNEFRDMIADDTAISAIYQYFNTLKGYDGYTVDRFFEIPKPTTVYQQNIQNANMDTVEQWLIYLASANNKDLLEMTGTDYADMYNDWAKSQRMKYDMSAKNICVKLMNMVGGFCTKGRHTRRGNTIYLNLKNVRDTYGIHCIDEEDDTTEDED